MILLLYGLPCAGKTTLGKAFADDIGAIHLDGDVFRDTFNNDLGFTELDRHINLDRAGSFAKLLNDQGFDVVCSFVAPTIAARAVFRQACGGGCMEVLVDTPLSICIDRDTKGMYAKAREGLIQNFTGVHNFIETEEIYLRIFFDLKEKQQEKLWELWINNGEKNE